MSGREAVEIAGLALPLFFENFDMISIFCLEYLQT
jgi:hypothetical protein